MKKVIILFTFIACMLALSGCTEEGGFFGLFQDDDSDVAEHFEFYLKDDDTYVVSGDEDSVKYLSHISIPTEYEGKAVTEIGDSAFSSCSRLTSIVIPDGIKTIGENAFYNCESLASVTIGSDVTSIKSNAFGSCIRLVEVVNKSSLNIKKGEDIHGKVGKYAIDIKKSGTTLESEGEYIFYTDTNGKNYLIEYMGDATELTLPDKSDTTYEIYKNAFLNEKEITKVEIPNSVTAIGEASFKGCISVESLKLSDNLISIGKDSFRGCESLKSIDFPAKLEIIEEYAFTGCHSIKKLVIPGGVEKIGTAAFDSCLALYDLTISEGVKEIGSTAFRCCLSLISVTIPHTVRTVGHMAFEDCTSLMNLKIGGSVERIGEDAFRNCEMLQSAEFTRPNGWVPESEKYSIDYDLSDKAMAATFMKNQYFAIMRQ